jgi:cytochrome c553
MRSLPIPLSIVAAAALASLAGVAPAGDPTPEQLEFFEKKVRPVLVERCLECHGEDAQESELRLDSLAAILKGGMRGPAIVPGNAAESLLVRAIGHGETLQMPPKKKLPAAQIADLAAWVKQGAPWPNEKLPEVTAAARGTAALRPAMVFTEKQKSHWAFQPIAAPPLPEVQDKAWPLSPIDRFVLEKLEAAGLAPSPPAVKRTLLRRATFDLTGLPPTPEEIETFLADGSPDAFARVVDRLLASPRYGEKYGRHWLDLARYGDSNGLDENLAYVNAFRYRDYVIAAFNKDKPYDRFVQEQVAGDLLPHAGLDEELEGIVATGFLSLGAKMLAEDDPVKMQMDIIDEQIDTLGKCFLGLTLGCARCHDHKYDPVDQPDYYALAGIFKSTKTMENHKVVAVWQERPLADKESIARRDEIKKQLDAKRGEVNSLVAAAAEALKAERQKAGAEPPKEKIEEAFPDDVKEKLKTLRDEAAAIEKTLPQIPEAMAVSDAAAENVRIHIRGSHLTLAEEVPRRFLRIVAGENQPPIDHDRSGRLELATG